MIITRSIKEPTLISTVARTPIPLTGSNPMVNLSPVKFWNINNKNFCWSVLFFISYSYLNFGVLVVEVGSPNWFRNAFERLSISIVWFCQLLQDTSSKL